MNTQTALQIIQLHAAGTRITQTDVSALLANVKGVTFAQIVQCTPVALAAKHKAIVIQKVTEASVQLFNNLAAETSVYANAVKRSATAMASDPANVAAFEVQETWFEHTAECYSIVKHKTKEAYYLYAIYNGGKSVYIMDGKELTKAEVAEYLTPSAAKALLTPEDGTYNVGQDIVHNVTVRVTGMDNIVSIVAQKQLLIK